MEIVPAEYDTVTVLNDLIMAIRPRAESKDLYIKCDIDGDIPVSKTVGASDVSEMAKGMEVSAESRDEIYIKDNHAKFVKMYRENAEKIDLAFNGDGKERTRLPLEGFL